MQLTTYTDYAFRALIALGCVAPEKLTAAQIAESYDISLHHLLKVVQKLAERGYVETTRGKSGGVRLAVEPRTLKLGQIVRDMEPELGLVACLRDGDAACAILPDCSLKSILANATEHFIAELDRHTLAELIASKSRLRGLLQLGRVRQLSS